MLASTEAQYALLCLIAIGQEHVLLLQSQSEGMKQTAVRLPFNLLPSLSALSACKALRIVPEPSAVAVHPALKSGLFRHSFALSEHIMLC